MNKKKQHEQEMSENDLVSYLEEKLGHLKPYWSQIALGACVLVLGVLGIVYLFQQRQASEAGKWQALIDARMQYRNTGDNTLLIDFADSYPDDTAGLWGLLFAADAETRSGLADFATDRKSGFDKISKAEDFYQRIVDSSVDKTTELQRRSVFGLAYAHESSGNFAKAAPLYQQLVDAGDDNPFLKEAKRGLARSTSADFAAVFDKFREFEVDETAPGLQLPRRPDISFPEVGVQPNSGGGEFAAVGSGDSDTDDEPTDNAPDGEGN